MRLVGRWAKRHKIWTGVILFFIISWILGAIGVDTSAVGRVFGILIGFFVITWLIIKVLKKVQKKDGDGDLDAYKKEFIVNGKTYKFSREDLSDEERSEEIAKKVTDKFFDKSGEG